MTLVGSAQDVVLTGDQFAADFDLLSDWFTPTTSLPSPAVGMAAAPGSKGYWITGSDGSVVAFGNAPYDGSASEASRWPRRWWAWRPPLTARATGRSPPTAASSPSATPASTGPPGRSTSTSPSSAWPPPPTAGATGWWPPTAASSATATPRSSGRRAAIHLNQPIVGHGAAADGQGRLLAGGLRRRGLRFRRRPLLRLDGRPAAQPSRRGDLVGARRHRLLAGRLGRRHLRLRERRLLRLGRGRPAGAAGRRAWPPPRTVPATGWSPPTAASSTTGTPRSSDPEPAPRDHGPRAAVPEPSVGRHLSRPLVSGGTDRPSGGRPETVAMGRVHGPRAESPNRRMTLPGP